MLMQKKYLIPLGILLLILSLTYFPFSGSRPFLVPDEGRYVEIPREMIANKDFITPHLNHIEYFEKPPLFYWLEASTIKTLGLAEWSARLPSIILGLMGCVLLLWTGITGYGRKTAIISSLVLASSGFYFMMAHTVSPDMAFSVFLSFSLLCTLLGFENPSGRVHKTYLWGASIFSGLAVMTKGLIGLFFPLWITGLWFLLSKSKWPLLKHIPWIRLIAIFVAITFPWHIVIQLKHPEFFHFYFIEQHVLRFLTPYAGRGEPIWFFIPVIIVGFLPWSIYFIPLVIHTIKSIRINSPTRSVSLFLTLWFLSIFLFFSFSHSKLATYVLPAFPPLALLTGNYLAKNKTGRKRLWDIPLFFLTILYAIAYLLLHYLPLTDNPIHVAYYFKISFIITTVAYITLWILQKRLPRQILFCLSIFAILISYIPLSLSIPYIEESSSKSIALYLKNQLAQRKGLIFTYSHYYQDLPVYLERPVIIVDWHNELRFGEQFQPNAKQWLWEKDTFKQFWNSYRGTIYVVLSQDDYLEFKHDYPNAFIFFTTKHDVLLANYDLIA